MQMLVKRQLETDKLLEDMAKGHKLTSDGLGALVETTREIVELCRIAMPQKSESLVCPNTSSFGETEH
jgi:hypothetical protein